MAYEAMRAAEILADQGVDAEVIDLRSARPLDEVMLLGSIEKTGRLVVADTSGPSAVSPPRSPRSRPRRAGSISGRRCDG